MFVRHGLVLAIFAGLPALAAEAPAAGPRAIDPRAAIEPAAPVLPAEVVAAMQEGRYGPAQEALAKLSAETAKASEKAYYGLIQGIAQRLAGPGDARRGRRVECGGSRPTRGVPGRRSSGSSWPRSSWPPDGSRPPRGWPRTEAVAAPGG